MKQGWEIKKLREVCESDLGKTLNQSKDRGELYPYLCAINVLWDKIDFTTIKQTKFEKSELERYSVQKGDLLICEGGDIGRAAIWNKDEAMLYQNALHRVRFDGTVIPRFCLLYLRFLKDIGILDSQYGKGVTIKHLVKSSLLSIPIPVPPLPIQEKIVAELDCLSGIIEKKRQQLKELDALAQSVFYTMFGDPVGNDKGWEVKKFKDCYKLTSGKNLTAKKIIEGDYPVYGGNGIVGYHCDYNLDGDNIIIGRVGALCGNVRNIFGKAYITDNAFILTKLEEGNNVFILYLLRLHDLRQYARDALQPVISNAGFQNIEIILPPLPLQQEFAKKIEAIEAQKELVKKSIDEVQTLFDSRMQEYFG